MSSVSKPRVRQNRHKQGLNQTLEKISADFRLNVIPVVYLEGRINHYNDDDTPEFNELNQLCQNLFQDEVLPEIRPVLFEQNNEA